METSKSIALFSLLALALFGSIGATALMVNKTASADISGEYNRVIWSTTRQPAPLLTKTDAIGTGNALHLDPGDQGIMHVGADQSLETVQPWLDKMLEIQDIDHSNLGVEFFSLQQIEDNAEEIASQGFGFISYDLEAGNSPSAEVADPIGSFEHAANITEAAGLELQATPSQAITSDNDLVAGIAPLVDYWHIQSQSKQDDDTTCATLKNYVVDRTNEIQDASNDALNGHISYQLSFSQGAATGKTVYQTMVDCTKATTPTLVDGQSVFWNGAAFDATTNGLSAFWTFYENGYSRNNPN